MKDTKFNSGGNFNPDHRDDRGNGAENQFHISVGDGHDRAIVIVGNGSAVQPRVNRRVGFCRRHEKPNCQ